MSDSKFTLGEVNDGGHKPPTKYRYVQFKDAETYYCPPPTRWKKVKWWLYCKFLRFIWPFLTEKEKQRRQGEKI